MLTHTPPVRTASPILVEEGRLRGEVQVPPPAGGVDVDFVDSRQGGARRSRETPFAVLYKEKKREFYRARHTPSDVDYDGGGHPYDKPDGQPHSVGLEAISMALDHFIELSQTRRGSNPATEGPRGSLGHTSKAGPSMAVES
jgi:hypothetical protein